MEDDFVCREMLGARWRLTFVCACGFLFFFLKTTPNELRYLKKGGGGEWEVEKDEGWKQNKRNENENDVRGPWVDHFFFLFLSSFSALLFWAEVPSYCDSSLYSCISW